MFKKLLLFGILIFGIAVFAGCREYFSKKAYFNSAVIVEYKQTRARDSNDYLTLRFYEKGAYEIHFSVTPGYRGDDKDIMPQDIIKTIEVAPREIIIEQYVLPSFLRVTIIKDGKSESHDFS